MSAPLAITNPCLRFKAFARRVRLSLCRTMGCAEFDFEASREIDRLLIENERLRERCAVLAAALAHEDESEAVPENAT